MTLVILKKVKEQILIFFQFFYLGRKMNILHLCYLYLHSNFRIIDPFFSTDRAAQYISHYVSLLFLPNIAELNKPIEVQVKMKMSHVIGFYLWVTTAQVSCVWPVPFYSGIACNDHFIIGDVYAKTWILLHAVVNEWSPRNLITGFVFILTSAVMDSCCWEYIRISLIFDAVGNTLE